MHCFHTVRLGPLVVCESVEVWISILKQMGKECSCASSAIKVRCCQDMCIGDVQGPLTFYYCPSFSPCPCLFLPFLSHAARSPGWAWTHSVAEASFEHLILYLHLPNAKVTLICWPTTLFLKCLVDFPGSGGTYLYSQHSEGRGRLISMRLKPA